MYRPTLANQLPKVSVVLLLTGIILVSLFVGVLIAILPWWLTLAFVIIPGIIFLAFAIPYHGLLLTILLIFNAIPTKYIAPKLLIGGGGLAIYDLLILLLLASVLFRCVLTGTPLRSRLDNLFIPLVYVIGCVLVSIFYVRYFSPNLFVISEARQHIAWMLLPIGVLAIDTSTKYRWYINTLLVTAVTVAGIMIFQSLTDINIIGGRVEELDTTNSDVTRSTAGGTTYLIIFGVYFFLGAMISRRLAWWIGVPLLIILISGLLVTFGRGVWFGTLVGLMVAVYVHRGVAATVIVPIAAALLIGAAIAVVSLSDARMGEAIIDRALGVSQELETGNSYHYRMSESTEALNVILDNPIMGVGLGGDYKTSVTPNNTFDGETRYIHNGYLLLPVKMGLHATLIPVLFIIAGISLMRRAISIASPTFRHIPAAATGAFVVPVITSFTQPEWGVLPGIAAICSILLVLLLHTKFGTELQSAGTRLSNRTSLFP
jgi:O-antigen ligase